MRATLAAVVSTLLGVIAVAACGGGTSKPNGGVEGDPGVSMSGIGLPCDVHGVVAANCQECHTTPPRFGAPMSLLSRDDLLKPAPSNPARRVIDVALERIDGNPSPMPPAPHAMLADADRQVLRDWASAGTPAFEGKCQAPSTPTADGGVPAAKCTPDTKLLPASPWAMPKTGGDVYVCWGAELTAPSPRHVTGFVPRIDNTAIVHHVVLFEAPNEVSSTPAPCNPGGAITWRMVMGWAPGGGPLELPAEAGFPIASDGKATHYVVQMHYSNPQALDGQTDSSGFDLCTDEPRPQEADVMAFGTQDFSIPPNPPNGGVFTTTCDMNVPALFNGIHLFAAMPHMHKLGHHMSTTQRRGGVDVADLGTVPSFSFDAQAWMPVDADLATNDKVRTTCAWKNGTGKTVSFGETTAEEMCYSFTIYWPKIQATTWSWALPAVRSTCQ